MGPSTHSRALGAIWGTCVGDALGGPIQFQAPGTFQPIRELEFVKPFNEPSGYNQIKFRPRLSTRLTVTDHTRTMVR